MFFKISISLSLKIKGKLSWSMFLAFSSFYDVFICFNYFDSILSDILRVWTEIKKSKMVDQDGRHSEMITQLLRHMTSSPNDADAKGDIFGRTIYPPSLVVIAFIFSELRRGGGIRPKKPGINGAKKSEKKKTKY